MLDNTLTSVPDLDDFRTIRIDDLPTSTNSISSDTFQNALTWATASLNSNYYYSTPLYSSSMHYSSKEILSTIKSIFDSYGFEFSYNSDNDIVSNNSLSEKETSSDILGWVAVGFLKNKSYLSNFQLWIRFATDNKLDPTAITLIVKEGSYFENFSIKILLENNLVLIDSTSGIVHIIQEMLLENLQKAFDEIIEGLEPKIGQGTSSSGYGGYSYGSGLSVSYDADTTVSVNNYGVSN